MVSGPDLSVDLAGLVLKNPVMSASGTFGYGQEFAEFVHPRELGAVVTKGVSLKPRAGNPPPRIVETAAGMLNAIGLENVGVENFLERKLPWLLQRDAVVVVNVYGQTAEEYALVAQALDQSGVAMLELNISCPNVAAGGLAFGVDPEATFNVVRGVVQSTRLPVMVKLTPMVSDILETAQAAIEAGAKALSLINTLPAMAVDLDTRRPKLANIIGGLSGPAIKPVALRLVWMVARAVTVPVVGVGGIMNARDALEFILAGAAAVQIGTANFVNPKITSDIINGIETYLRENHLTQVSQLRGRLETSG